MILTFIRSAYEGFDEEINIHADGLINGQKVDKAAVLTLTTRRSYAKWNPILSPKTWQNTFSRYLNRNRTGY
jgi:hypothetical protein